MKEIEPFLQLFQCEKPMTVFLFQRLKGIILSLMKRLVRSDVIEASTVRKLLQPNLNDETELKLFKDSANLLGSDSIDIGFGAKSILKKLTTVQMTKAREFRANTKAFLIKLLNKLGERCPLKYSLTLYISSLSPTEISTAPDKTLEKRFEKLLEVMLESKWLTAVSADRAKKQYSEFITNKDALKKVDEFDYVKDRLDVFYMDILSDNEDMKDLLRVVTIVLILSHGQARVESGFSVNEKVLVENQNEESVIAQRLVYEGVKEEGGVLEVDINASMRKYVRQASSKAKAAAADKAKQKTEGDIRREERKRISKELNEATSAKKAAVESMKDKISSYDDTIKKLKKKL